MTITVSTMKGSLGVNKKNLFSCECDFCITVRCQGLELMGYILMKSWLDYRGVLYNTSPQSHKGPVQSKCILKNCLQRLEFEQPHSGLATKFSIPYLRKILPAKKGNIKRSEMFLSGYLGTRPAL